MQRSFRYEADLVARGKELLPSFLWGRKKTWRMTEELTVGAAIADIVLARTPRSFSANIPVLSARDSVLLAALRKLQTARIDRLERACGLERGSLRNGELATLLDAGLIERRGGGHIALTNDWAMVTDLVAVEAKLVRWQEALRQANNYSNYADRVYVMLSDQAPDECAERCAELGVGLLVVRDMRLVERIPAAIRSGHGWRREYALSRVLARA